MKLIHSPTVYVVGRQTIDGDQLDKFLADHQATWNTDTLVAGERLVEAGGRVCYMSFAKPRPGGNKAYIDHILEVGHGSVLEHAVWNLIVVGVSRSLSHELVRHRVGVSPSQLSQRYVDESVAEYVVPPDLQLEVEAYRFVEAYKRNGPVREEDYPRAFRVYRSPELGGLAELARLALVGESWVMAVAASHRAYQFIADHLAAKARSQGLEGTEARKFARQAARSVLPNATETKLFLTMNARAARHFIGLRCSRHADPEIRVLAHSIWKVLRDESPHLFGDFQEVLLPDGTVELQGT
jgi:thymidylate synthase (FAD)